MEFPLFFDEQTKHNIQQWLSEGFDKATQEQILTSLKENPKSLVDSFYKTLSFGTGGLRGVMGIGSNRMNIYTVRAATQGLASYLKMQNETGPISVIIGYDSRHNSEEFAKEVACVLAHNEINVFIFKQMRPVPLVSFGCRYKQCQAGIMITASHNPPEYNGYKVYWQGGGQVLPPHDEGIIEQVQKIQNPALVAKSSLDDPLIEWIDEELDEAYIAAIRPLRYPFSEDAQHHPLKIIYTSLHGTGITIVPKVLKDWGFHQLQLLKEQIEPDGDFPTCKSPNPEDPKALNLGLHKLLQTSSDLFIATDPDTDRLGVVCRHQGEAFILSGNEIACIAVNWLLKHLSYLNLTPQKAGFLKTIVTSELFATIVGAHHSHCENVLTGFKYIGQKIDEWQQSGQYQYLFGGEESYGYLMGTHVRDKDAVISAALICQIAQDAKNHHLTLIDLLYEIYNHYGLYREKLASISVSGKEGIEQMQKMMALLRKEPPRSFAGVPVTAIEDYQTGQRTLFPTLKKEKLQLPESDVLLFWLQDKSKLVVRPSGTEPKVKIYCGTTFSDFDSIDTAIVHCDEHADKLIHAMQSHFSS